MSDIDMPNDGARLRMVRTLFDHGHAERVLISHDITHAHALCRSVRRPRLSAHLRQYRTGACVCCVASSRRTKSTLLTRNPRRLLTFL